MNARNQVFLVLGLLTVGSLIWYLATVRPSADLQLIGTVDANEVLVSSKISGRIQRLTVDEGQQVKASQLIAIIESEDLQAARQAAEATAASQKSKLNETVVTERQTRGETSSATVNATAQLQAAQAALAQAQANYAHQQADTSRTVALAKQGIMSQQAKDDAVTSLQSDKAAVDAARENLAAAEASLRQAAGAPIVTIMDLSQTWIYAPLPETQADAVELGDWLRVVMPSGATLKGQVINKSAQADFATQRDVSARKRDIKTVQLKLVIDNPGERFVPGMTAEVYVPKNKLVKK